MGKGRVVPLRPQGIDHTQAKKRAQNEERYALLRFAELIDANRHRRRAVRLRKRRGFAG
jgi:hypothetical protein